MLDPGQLEILPALLACLAELFPGPGGPVDGEPNMMWVEGDGLLGATALRIRWAKLAVADSAVGDEAPSDRGGRVVNKVQGAVLGLDIRLPTRAHPPAPDTTTVQPGGQDRPVFS